MSTPYTHKIKIPGTTIANVCATFQLGELLSSPKRVSDDTRIDGVVLRLHTTTGLWALKAQAASKFIKMEETIRFERELYENGMAIPQPRLTSTGGGTLLLPAGVSVNVREWVNAPQASWSPEVRHPQEALLLAALLARLHTRKWRNTRVCSTWYTARRRAPQWESLLSMAKSQDKCWAVNFIEALPRLLWAEGLIGAAALPQDQCMCHLDAHPHNVLIVSNGSIRLIDWDGTGMASASSELADAVLNWACSGDGQPFNDLPRKMLQTYRDHGGTFEMDGLDVFAQHLIGWMNWIEINVELALGELPPFETVRFDESVAHLFT